MRFAILVILMLLPSRLDAQVGVPRSSQYRTAAMGGDVRVGWSNPAGLAARPEASIMAELRYDRLAGGGGAVGQFSLGLNSRGFSLIYQRDRFQNGNRGNTYRFSVANPFEIGSIGLAYTVYRGTGPSSDGFDVGIRLRLTPRVDGGAVIRNITSPVVRNVRLPVTAVASVGVRPLEGLLLSVEIAAADRNLTTGYDVNYRGLVNIWSPAHRASLIGVVDIDSNRRLATISFGFAYGGADSGLGFGTLDRTGPTTRLSSVSVTGVSSRELLRARR